MVIFVECLPADKPWDMVSATRRSSGVAPRACVRVYARVLVPPNLYIHTYIDIAIGIYLSYPQGHCFSVRRVNHSFTAKSAYTYVT